MTAWEPARVEDATSILALVDFSGSIAPGTLALGLLCLALAALGATAAASLLVYSPTKLLKKLKNGRRELLTELQQRDPEYQVVARLLLLGGLLGAFLFVQAAAEGGLLFWTLMTSGVLALLFCGVLPAAVAESRAESALIRILPLLRVLWIAFRHPIVRPIHALTRGVLRLLRISGEPSTDRDEIADEIMAAVSDSADENALEEEEKLWIGNIVELKDLQVSEVMTPRTDLVAVEGSTPLREAVAMALKTGFSRYPVYTEKVDDVAGVFYVKDALRLTQESDQGIGPDSPVSSMMREPLFVPETMGVVELLRKLKATKLQMAIVLDEYGGTAGLISVEDILEEIVGDISDEYDLEEEAPIKVVEQGRVLEISARTRVEEVNERLGTELLEDGDYDTIAGFVISHLGRIPAVGESFQVEGVEFRILRANERRLGRLRVAALHTQAADGRG